MIVRLFSFLRQSIVVIIVILLSFFGYLMTIK